MEVPGPWVVRFEARSTALVRSHWPWTLTASCNRMATTMSCAAKNAALSTRDFLGISFPLTVPNRQLVKCSQDRIPQCRGEIRAFFCWNAFADRAPESHGAARQYSVETEEAGLTMQ